MKKLSFVFAVLFVASTFHSCIGEDIKDDEVAERIVISERPAQNRLSVDDTHQLDFNFFNNVGQRVNDNVDIVWQSENENIATVSNTGLVTAIQAGTSTISAEVLEGGVVIAQNALDITVTEAPTETPSEENPNTEPPVAVVNSGSGSFTGANGYAANGDFTITEVAGSNSLELSIASNYRLDDFLPGPYIYLSNNPNSINGALEIGRVRTFNGAHSYTIQNADIDDYAYVLYWCKPFNAKIGGGAITVN